MFLNALVLISLYFAWIALYVDPNDIAIFSFFGLAFPYIFITSFFIPIIWWYFNKRRAWLNLLLIAPCFLLGHRLFRLFPSKSDILDADIQIMSYNVRNFDLYNWSNNNQAKNQIMDFLKITDPDILCIQEFFNTTDPKHDFKTLEILENELSASNSHIDYTNTVNGTENWGIATFSRYPIVGKEQLTFPLSPNNICIITDLKIDQDTIRIYNVHLASIHFSDEDYSMLNQPKNQISDEKIEGWSKILEKLGKAYMLRATQVDIIAEHIQRSPYPVVLCGDFNDTPISYAYQQLSNQLQDAFLVSGSGEGRTYNGAFPSYRIDYIMHSNHFSDFNFQVHPENNSDHYPISSTLRLISH